MRSCQHIVVLMLIALASPGVAQNLPTTVRELTLRSTSACPTCAIEMTVEVVLGEDESSTLGEANRGVRLPNGSFWLATGPALDELLIFSRQGMSVRSIGRSGQGPGEFGMVADIRLRRADGSIAVLDYRNSRITTYDSLYRVVGETQLSFPFSEFDVLPDSQFVVSGVVPTADLVGKPLHVIASSGRIVRSFGGSDVPFGSSSIRRVRSTSGGTIWSVSTKDYVLEQWRQDGAPIVRISHVDPWPGGVLATVAGEPVPPPSVVRAIEVASNGMLWVLSILPDKRWRQSLRRKMNPGAVIPAYVVTDNAMYYDSRLDAVDPRTGQLLATVRIDEYVYGFADAQRILKMRATEDGAPIVEVVRIVLRR